MAIAMYQVMQECEEQFWVVDPEFYCSQILAHIGLALKIEKKQNIWTYLLQCK